MSIETILARLRAAPPFDPERRRNSDSLWQLQHAAADIIAELQAELRQKDEEIARLNDKLTEANGRIALRDSIIPDLTEHISMQRSRIEHLESWQESTIDLLMEAEVQIDALGLDDLDLECERRSLKHRIIAEVAKVRSPAPLPGGTTKRKAFICIHCDGVYIDQPVSQCDCVQGSGADFVEGFVEYQSPKLSGEQS